MRDGQGCLLPVLRCPRQNLLLDEDHPYMVPWCYSQSLRAGLSSERKVQNSGKRKKARKQRAVIKAVAAGAPIDVKEQVVVARTACPADQESNDQGDDTSLIPGLDEGPALRCLAFVSRSDHGKLAMLARRYLDLVRSPLLYKLRRSYDVVEQWVYMYATGPGWTAFDPKRCLWMTLPPTNAGPNFCLSDRESLSAGTHLLWLGKETFDFVVYRYDLITNSWERGSDMNNPRCLFASASCGRFAYVAGGFGEGTGNVLRSAEMYDSELGTWDRLPDMHIARHKSSGCYMDGKFYVVGGKDRNHKPVESGEEYDPVTKTWRIISNMYPAPVQQMGGAEPCPPLVAVVDNRLYAIENSINCVKVYEKGTNTWRLLGPVPVRADFHNGWGLAFKAVNDELCVIGGYRDPMGQNGIAVFSWRPGSEADTPDWRLITARFTGTGNFLYNCAVMAC